MLQTFIKIYFSCDRRRITTNGDFPLFENKTKLQTIMIIIDIIYRHFKQPKIEVSDAAEFSCDRDYKFSYNAQLHRIFRGIPSKDISIYEKFGFNYLCQFEYELAQIQKTTIGNFLEIITNLILDNEESNKNNVYIVEQLSQVDSTNTLVSYIDGLIKSQNLELCKKHIIFLNHIESLLLLYRMYNLDNKNVLQIFPAIENKIYTPKFFGIRNKNIKLLTKYNFFKNLHKILHCAGTLHKNLP